MKQKVYAINVYSIWKLAKGLTLIGIAGFIAQSFQATSTEVREVMLIAMFVAWMMETSNNSKFGSRLYEAKKEWMLQHIKFHQLYDTLEVMHKSAVIDEDTTIENAEFHAYVGDILEDLKCKKD